MQLETLLNAQCYSPNLTRWSYKWRSHLLALTLSWALRENFLVEKVCVTKKEKNPLWVLTTQFILNEQFLIVAVRKKTKENNVLIWKMQRTCL